RRRCMSRITTRRSFMVHGLTRRTRLTTGAPATGRMAAQFWARAWHLVRAMRLGAGPAGPAAEVIGAVTPTSTGTTTTSTSIGQAAAVETGTTGPSAGKASVTTTKASPIEWARATTFAAAQVIARTSAVATVRRHC